MRRSANHCVLVLALALAACSECHPPRRSLLRRLRSRATKPVLALRVEMQQDEGGFTIVEEVRVGNDIHATTTARCASSSRSSTSKASRRC